MAAHEFGAGTAIIVSLAGVVAAVGLAAAVVAWRRGLLGIRESLAVVGATLVVALLLSLLAPSSEPDSSPATPVPLPAAFAQRANALLSQAMAPNSPLACIDAVAGDKVEAACEALLFGRPETIAAAVTYVTAKIALLSQGQAEANPEEPALVLLQRNLAADQYGIVAHVLATTAGCSAERCDAFALVKDASQIKANLLEGTFDRLVAKHVEEWSALGKNTPGAADADAPNVAARPHPGKPVPSRFDFPSAASIPAISIMVPEEPPGVTDRKSPGPAPKRIPKPRPAAAPAPPAPASAQPLAAPPSPAPPSTATGPARTE